VKLTCAGDLHGRCYTEREHRDQFYWTFVREARSPATDCEALPSTHTHRHTHTHQMLRHQQNFPEINTQTSC